jgi:hypothetical protein
MDRKEYLASLNQPAQTPYQECTESSKPISSLNEYLDLRRKCAAYEEFENISDQLTAADYKMFDKNFDRALQDALYTDEDFVEDAVDRTIRMMKSVNWIWANLTNGKSSTPDRNEFIQTIKHCYECCFEHGGPRGACSTGGITVEIDIVDHLVKIQFNSIDVFAYDNDDCHD